MTNLVAAAAWWITLVSTLVVQFDATRGQQLTPAQRQEALDTHNRFRRQEVRERKATNMRLMEWDTKLEAFVVEYLKQCKNRHTDKAARDAQGISPTEQIGENLVATTEPGYNNITDAIWLWYKERVDYDFVTRTCAPRKICGHYTQVVWKSTYRLGCAMQQCPPRFVLVLCDYGPTGNWPGLNPYEIGPEPCGEPCKKRGFLYCDRGLCSKVPPKDPTSGVRRGYGSLLVACLTWLWVAAVTQFISLAGEQRM